MRKHLTKTAQKNFSGLAGEMNEFQSQNRGKNMKVDLSFVEKLILFSWVLGWTQRLLGGAFNVNILFTPSQHSLCPFPINLAEQLHSSLILRTKSREGSLKPLLHQFQTGWLPAHLHLRGIRAPRPLFWVRDSLSRLGKGKRAPWVLGLFWLAQTGPMDCFLGPNSKIERRCSKINVLGVYWRASVAKKSQYWLQAAFPGFHDKNLWGWNTGMTID